MIILKRPSGSITIFALTGYTKNWTVLRDNGYIVEAYDETGTETEPWIDTDIENVEPTHLNSLELSIYEFSVYLRGKGESGNVTILKHSRSNFANGGIYNKQRKCYYPSGTSNKEIAETNKINKLFKKWGFKHLQEAYKIDTSEDAHNKFLATFVHTDNKLHI